MAANCQFVDYSKFFLSLPTKKAYSCAGTYPEGECDVLRCHDISPKYFFLANMSIMFLKERLPCVAWDGLRKIKGKQNLVKKHKHLT